MLLDLSTLCEVRVSKNRYRSVCVCMCACVSVCVCVWKPPFLLDEIAAARLTEETLPLAEPTAGRWGESRWRRRGR